MSSSSYWKNLNFIIKTLNEIEVHLLVLTYLERILIAVIFANLSACSYIKNLFPDKGKDYQYTTEIPPLVIPPGLTDNPAFKSSSAPSEANAETVPTESHDQIIEEPTQEESKTPEVNQNQPGFETSEKSAPSAGDQDINTIEAESEQKGPASNQTSGETVSPKEAGISTVTQPAKNQPPKNGIPVDLVIYNDGETRLRIGADKTQAWHMVGKALMRNSIEVTERNQEEGTYHVVFEPDEKPIQDGSLWDEAVFIFKGFQSKGKPFLLKIIGDNQQSDVAVLDEDGKPASDKAALRMLKQILQTLKAE